MIIGIDITGDTSSQNPQINNSILENSITGIIDEYEVAATGMDGKFMRESLVECAFPPFFEVADWIAQAFGSETGSSEVENRHLRARPAQKAACAGYGYKNTLVSVDPSLDASFKIFDQKADIAEGMILAFPGSRKNHYSLDALGYEISYSLGLVVGVLVGESTAYRGICAPCGLAYRVTVAHDTPWHAAGGKVAICGSVTAYNPAASVEPLQRYVIIREYAGIYDDGLRREVID